MLAEPRKPFETTKGTPSVAELTRIKVALLLTLRVPNPAALTEVNRTGPLLSDKPVVKVLLPPSDKVPLPMLATMPLPAIALFKVTEPPAPRFATRMPLLVTGPLPRLP